MPIIPRGLYAIDSPPFTQTFRACALANRDQIAKWYAEPITRSEALLDAYYAFSAQYVWTFDIVRPNPSPTEKLLFSSVHKNQIALFATLELIRSGFFGPARALLRQIFEAQLMAKFAAVRGDNDLADHWLADGAVFVGRAVFPKIPVPYVKPLKQFWTVLHPFVHASPSSQQVSPYAEHNKEEIGLDLMLLSLLLHTQYHLLSKHAFSARSHHYANQYDTHKVLPILKAQIRDLQKANAAHFSSEGRALIRAFRAPWVIGP